MGLSEVNACIERSNKDTNNCQMTFYGLKAHGRNVGAPFDTSNDLWRVEVLGRFYSEEQTPMDFASAKIQLYKGRAISSTSGQKVSCLVKKALDKPK